MAKAEMKDGKDGKRFLWIDVIKVFSTFLIVLQHSISDSFTSLPVSGPEWKLLNGIFMISRMGVPVFFLCSGAGMLAREHTVREIWRKQIPGLLKVYIGWMAILGIRDAVQIGIAGENAGLRVMINAFLKCILFGKYHTWFIFTLLGLYAVTPLMYRIAEKRELLSYFLVLSILFTVVLPLFSKIEWLGRLMAVVESVNMQFVTGYSLYFLAGYYICRYLDRRWEKYAGLAFIASAAAAYVWSLSASLRAGGADHEAYGLFSPCGFIMSVSLMVLFKKYVGAQSASGLLNGAAGLQKYGIAVYLLHIVFVEAWTKGSGMACVPAALLVWVVSMAVSMVVYRIPVLGKVLFLQRR